MRGKNRAGRRAAGRVGAGDLREEFAWALLQCNSFPLTILSRFRVSTCRDRLLNSSHVRRSHVDEEMSAVAIDRRKLSLACNWGEGVLWRANGRVLNLGLLGRDLRNLPRRTKFRQSVQGRVERVPLAKSSCNGKWVKRNPLASRRYWIRLSVTNSFLTQ